MKDAFKSKFSNQIEIEKENSGHSEIEEFLKNQFDELSEECANLLSNIFISLEAKR